MACSLHAPLYNSTRIIIFPCAGNAGSFRCDRGDYARVLFYFAREAAGALGARHSLRPLLSRGANGFCKTSGASRRGNAQSRPLGCLKIESETTLGDVVAWTTSG